MGIFEGKPIREIDAIRYATGDYNAYIPEGGESIKQLTDRVMKWLELNYDSLNNSLIVSHRGVMSILLSKTEKKNEYDINEDTLKHGNIIVLKLFSMERCRITDIIELGK